MSDRAAVVLGIAIVSAAVVLAMMDRYSGYQDGPVAIRVDRLTGQFAECTPDIGCIPFGDPRLK